jgi:O-antigen ligase
MASMVPLSAWLRQNPREAPKLWLFVGFLAVQHGPLHVYMALDSWAGQWPGYTFGAEISLLDLIIVAIYVTLPRTQHSTPFLFPMGLYLFASIFSVFQASVPNAAAFYPWQLLRVFFFYIVVAKACAVDERVIGALLKGMALGILLAAGQSVWERFGAGVLQTAGGFPHRNFLGLVSHFIVYPFFALWLLGERSWFPAAVSIGGALIAILTTSRATIAFAGFGYVLLFMISAMRGWTAQKSKVLVAGVVAVIALSPLFFSSFAQRFGSDEVEDSFFQADDVRLKMEDAAHLMLAEHPMGVGANHYVYAANSLGYNERVGLSWANFGAYVHNAYWLVAVETGYFGLAAFVIMLTRPMIVAFACGWRNRRDKRGDVLLGLGVGLVTVYLHNLYEWVFVSFQTEYLFAANAAMIAGLAQQLGYWRRSQVARRPVPVTQTARSEAHLRIDGSYPADINRH